jgi:hypothetical protein
MWMSESSWSSRTCKVVINDPRPDIRNFLRVFLKSETIESDISGM